VECFSTAETGVGTLVLNPTDGCDA
jgi:hypothetical protein